MYMVVGNYGATGVSSTKNTNTTTIQVLKGIIDGDIYGGGNRNGAGTTTKISTINISLKGGNVCRKHLWRKQYYWYDIWQYQFKYYIR